MARSPETPQFGGRPTVEDYETNPAVTPDGEVICRNCGNSFSSVTRHFALSGTCSYPNLTPRQQEVLTGVLVARGGVQAPSEGNGSIRVTDQNREMLTWIHDQLDWVGGSVLETPLDTFPDVDEDDVDMPETTHQLRTYSHPDFSMWRDRWHTDDGSRTAPTRIHRTRRMLRTAYALVGRYEPPGDSRAVVTLAFGRTKPESETLRQLFTGFGPSITRDEDHKTGTEQVRVRIYNVPAFFDYIGWNPVRGIEDRWPSSENRDRIVSADEDREQCPECGGQFSNLSGHFYDGEHDPPSLTEEMQAVVAGCVVAGGRVRTPKHDERGLLKIRVADVDRLSWVVDRLSWLSGSSYIEADADTVSEQMAVFAEGDGRIEASAVHTHQTRTHHELAAYVSNETDSDPTNRYPPAPQSGIAGPFPDHPTVFGVVVALRGFIASGPDGANPYLAVNPNRTRLSADELRNLFGDVDTRWWQSRSLVVTPEIDHVLTRAGVDRELIA